MRQKAGVWAVFLVCLLLLSLAATPYSRLADHALMAARFAVVILLSILVVHEKWKHRHDSEGQEPQTHRDAAESFLPKAFFSVAGGGITATNRLFFDLRSPSSKNPR